MAVKTTERRRGPDILIKWVDFFNVFLWLIVLASFIVLTYAKPYSDNMFDRAFGSGYRTYWDLTLLRINLIITGSLFLLSTTTIIINKMRCRRKSDRMRLSLIVSSIFSLILTVYLAFILF